jgi:hypothetical protein
MLSFRGYFIVITNRMEKLQRDLLVKTPSFLKQLENSSVPKRAKRYKITMAASMAV